MTISAAANYGTLYAALQAGYQLAVGDQAQNLGGGPVYTITGTNPTLCSTPTLGGNGQVQSGLIPPASGTLLASSSIAAFATLSISGGGSISSSAIVSGNLWNPTADGVGHYTVAFTSSTAWTVTNASSQQIASGTGTTVTFRGVSITVTSPVNGTTVTVTPTWN